MAGGRQTKLTPKNRAAFLTALRESGNVRAACSAARVSRQAAYTWREDDAVFAAAWHDAVEDACDRLEQVAWNRAEDVSDTLLIFLLKAHRPAKYRENNTYKHEHSGPDGAAIPIQFRYGDVIAEVAAGSGDDRDDD